MFYAVNNCFVEARKVYACVIKARHLKITSLLASHPSVFVLCTNFLAALDNMVEIIRCISSNRGNGEMKEGNLVFMKPSDEPRVKKMVK